MKHEYADSVAAGIAKLTPPAGVVAASVAGMSLQDWVYALTAIYTLLMIAHHIVTKWWLPWRRSRVDQG